MCAAAIARLDLMAAATMSGASVWSLLAGPAAAHRLVETAWQWVDPACQCQLLELRLSTGQPVVGCRRGPGWSRSLVGCCCGCLAWHVCITFRRSACCGNAQVIGPRHAFAVSKAWRQSSLALEAPARTRPTSASMAGPGLEPDPARVWRRCGFCGGPG